MVAWLNKAHILPLRMPLHDTRQKDYDERSTDVQLTFDMVINNKIIDYKEDKNDTEDLKYYEDKMDTIICELYERYD